MKAILPKLSLCGALMGGALLAAAGLRAVDPATRPDPGTPPGDTAAATNGAAAIPRPLAPGPDDGRIAYVTAQLLERQHYSRQRFDDEVSAKFLKSYLGALDPQRMHFVQTDVTAFELYSDKLDDLIIKRGDTWPAYEIFERFRERLEQRVAYATELLKTETFQFTNDDRVTLNRHDLAYPKDLDEAKALWRDRLRFEYLGEKLNKEKPEKIVETLTRRYQRTLRTFKDWEADDVLQVYLTALAHVYDPHSDYFNKSQAENFSIGMNLQLFGIGAELTQGEDGYCKINRLLPGPAEKSKKIKVNDRIIAVAQSNQPPADIVDMPLNKAVNLIRGPKGTEVRLTIIPVDADSSVRTIVSLIRDEIKLEDQEAKAKIIELPGPNGKPLRLGVIDLPSFYASVDFTGSKRLEQLAGADGKPPLPRSTSVDVAKLLAKLKQENVGGVILDLRRNGGGLLDEAIKLTGLFIKEGPVVQERDSDGSVRVDEDKDPAVLYDGPLIVLTSRFSASASEILAGALQDYGRALLVGDSSTHGKGTVQGMNPLRSFFQPGTYAATNDPGVLKLTVRKFYRASGASTQLKGVTPDIVLPSPNNVLEVGEAALDNPMPWDTIPSAKIERLPRVEPYLAELGKRSAARVSTEKDFDYMREDMALVKKQQDDKSVSLNEQQRLKEKEENDARTKARDKERLARKEPAQKVYELTLKLTDQPGLPPPTVKTNAIIAKSGKASANTVAATVPGVTAALVSTNSAAVAANATPTLKAGSVDTAEDEEKPPAIDVTLEEAEHILVDYLSVLPKEPLAPLAADSPARK